MTRPTPKEISTMTHDALAAGERLPELIERLKHAAEYGSEVEWEDARDAADLLESLLADLTAANARVKEAEGVIEPFAEAATHVPYDREDQNIVAMVPGGPHASAFQAMRKPLTAGAFRKAAQWLANREGRSDG